MRMWMVEPKYMCNKHLLGEHIEIHMFVGSINKGISMEGYIKNNLLEPSSLIERHDEIVKEMKRRGMNHNTPLPSIKITNLPEHLRDAKINKHEALEELHKRCANCLVKWLEENIK